jgi:UPF0716 protein FxsA
MALVLLILVPVVELYVIVQVSHAIGVVNTLGLLVAVSIVGGWIVKRQGLSVWRRVNLSVSSGRVPGDELIDGFLVLLAGALIVVPGFVTDALGLLLLLPPVRALVRVWTRHRFGRRVEVIRATYGGPIYDVSDDEPRGELGQ